MISFNEWWLGLPTEQRNIIHQDKWRLAEHSFEAGKRLRLTEQQNKFLAHACAIGLVADHAELLAYRRLPTNPKTYLFSFAFDRPTEKVKLLTTPVIPDAHVLYDLVVTLNEFCDVTKEQIDKLHSHLLDAHLNITMLQEQLVKVTNHRRDYARSLVIIG